MIRSAFLLLIFHFCVLNTFVTAQNESNSSNSKSTEFIKFDLTGSEFYNIKAGYYNESWIYSFFLNDSIHMTYSFNVSEIGGLKERVTGTKMMLSIGEEKKYVLNKEYSLSTFQFNSDNYFISLHPERSYWITIPKNGTQVVKLKTRKNGIDYNIELNNTITSQAIRLKDGKFIVQNETFFLEYLIPESNVKGYVKAGEDSILVTGKATLLHTYQTGKATKLIQEGIRYYSYQDLSNLNSQIGYFIQTKNNQWLGYGLSFNNQFVQITKPVYMDIVSSNKIRNTTYINESTVIWNTNAADEFVIDRIYHDYSYLDELNQLTRVLAKKFLGNEVIELQGNGFINQQKTFFECFVTQ